MLPLVRPPRARTGTPREEAFCADGWESGRAHAERRLRREVPDLLVDDVRGFFADLRC